MPPLSRLLLFFVLCLSCLPVGSAAAQSMQWIDMATVTTCPAHRGETTPPDFSAPGCRTTGLWKVDPQHHSLWLKARIAVPPALLDQSAPLGLFVSGKFASTAW